MGLGDDTAMSDGAPALQVFKDEFKRIIQFYQNVWMILVISVLHKIINIDLGAHNVFYISMFIYACTDFHFRDEDDVTCTHDVSLWCKII